MISQPNGIRVVLFDMGGVLVELSGLPKMLTWLKDRATAEQVYTMWLTSPNVRAFETGKMQPEVFAEQIISEMNLPVEKEEFLKEFSAWGLQLLPGALEMVSKVPRNYVRATLCNSNVLHWPNLTRYPELLGSFDHHFVSHVTGKIKPDAEAFQNVMDTLGCKASEILFLDDSRLNVAAAKKLGLTAFQIKAPAEAEQMLRQAGVLTAQPG